MSDRFLPLLMAIELLLKSDLIIGKIPVMRTLKNLKLARRAISPVIATVILVSTAVVISAAMSGFAGSLFSTYSQSPQIKIRDSIFSSSAGTVTVNFVNSGSIPDNLLSVSFPFGATTLTASGTNLSPNPAIIQPNTTTQVVATLTGTMPNPGQHITLTAVTTAGQSYTFTAIVGS